MKGTTDGALLATWGYLALFGATLVSSLGIPIGSEIAIGYAGALASGQLATTGKDHLSLALVILVAVAGEARRSAIGYGIGLFGGRPLVDKLGKFILLSHRDLDRAEAWFDGRGESVVFFARLIPLGALVHLARGGARRDGEGEVRRAHDPRQRGVRGGARQHRLQPRRELAPRRQGLQRLRLRRHRARRPRDRLRLLPPAPYAQEGAAGRQQWARRPLAGPERSLRRYEPSIAEPPEPSARSGRKPLRRACAEPACRIAVRGVQLLLDGLCRTGRVRSSDRGDVVAAARRRSRGAAARPPGRTRAPAAARPPRAPLGPCVAPPRRGPDPVAGGAVVAAARPQGRPAPRR